MLLNAKRFMELVEQKNLIKFDERRRVFTLTMHLAYLC